MIKKLAYPLIVWIVILSMGANGAGAAQTGSARTVAGQGEKTAKLDLNRAAQAELMKLPGIGADKARRIVEYRASKPFRSVEQVKEVRGIGRVLYERLKDLVFVGPPPAAQAK